MISNYMPQQHGARGHERQRVECSTSTRHIYHNIIPSHPIPYPRLVSITRSRHSRHLKFHKSLPSCPSPSLLSSIPSFAYSGRSSPSPASRHTLIADSYPATTRNLCLPSSTTATTAAITPSLCLAVCFRPSSSFLRRRPYQPAAAAAAAPTARAPPAIRALAICPVPALVLQRSSTSGPTCPFGQFPC